MCHADISPYINQGKGDRQWKAAEPIRGSSSVVYADVHLQAVHKLVRGTNEFSKALSVLYSPRGDKEDDLLRAMVEYG